MMFTLGLKLPLNDAGRVEVALQALFTFTRLLVQSRVFQTDGDIGPNNLERAFVFGGERIQVGAFQIQNTHETVLEQERNNQFRAHVVTVWKLPPMI
jgi:hypothetical protein